CATHLLSLLLQPPPTSTLFPYTTLFRSPTGRGSMRRQTSPSPAPSISSPVAGSLSTTSEPGSTLPRDPDFRLWPGVFAITNVVSVCPHQSRMSAFQAVLTALITTGLSGSPAANTFCGGLIILVRSAWINIRHTV